MLEWLLIYALIFVGIIYFTKGMDSPYTKIGYLEEINELKPKTVFAKRRYVPRTVYELWFKREDEDVKFRTQCHECFFELCRLIRGKKISIVEV